MKNIINKKFYLALIVFSLVGQIAWVVENMYFNVFIYEVFNASAQDIATMVMLSAITATLTTLLIGALSDKIGKRKLFICGGYIIWGITICSFALIRVDFIDKMFPYAVSASTIGVSLVIVLDCLMTFFGSSANDACFNAWLTDSTTTDNRGKVEGINSMMPLMAILVVFGGFMPFSGMEVSLKWTIIFLTIGFIVVGVGVIGLFIIEDNTVKIEENNNYFKNILYGFRPKVLLDNKMLYIALVIFAVFGISIQIFMPYLIIYYEKTLKLTNYVFIMAPAILLAGGFTFFYGRVYDKFKFFKSVYIPLILLIGGYLFLFCFTNVVCVFIGSLFMMCGYLSGMAVFGAVIRDYTPINKSGMFQGLRIVGQVLIPGVVGPFIGAKVLKNAEMVSNDDGTLSFLPNRNIFLASLVVILIVVILIAIIHLLSKKYKNILKLPTSSD